MYYFDFKLLSVESEGIVKGRRVYQQRIKADHCDIALKIYCYYLRDELKLFENNINEIKLIIEGKGVGDGYTFEVPMMLKSIGKGYYDVSELELEEI